MNKSATWPEDGLEIVEECLVCREKSGNKLWHKEINDKIFFTPGSWNLFKCTSCGSAFLNPRPAASHLKLAYEHYYTHQSSKARKAWEQLNYLEKIKRLLANSYINKKYQANILPTTKSGAILVAALPPIKILLDREYRNLPKIKNPQSTLLDVGCGNTFFLKKAASVGYKVIGLDTDPKVIRNGQLEKIQMLLGDLSLFKGRSEEFDAITMSHAIEHLPDPKYAINICYELLKPGGQIWIETPNVNSFGSLIFGNSWRGLEPPRHLVLFNRGSLIKLISSSGFVSVEDQLRQNPCAQIFKSSLFIKKNQQPTILEKIYINSMSFSLGALSFFIKNRREYITITAKKPLT